MSVRNLWVDKQGGSIVRILKTDDSFAYLQVVYPTQSKWAMPRGLIGEPLGNTYEKDFVRLYRPATMEDFERVQSQDEGTWELPKNAPSLDEWPRK